MDIFLNSNQYDRLLEGVWVTLQVLAFSFALGIVLSMVFGVARLSERRWVRAVALAYIEVFRGVSSLVLLFWFAFALPIIFGFEQLSRLLMGSVALGMNMGGYGAEIVRGAIQAVPKGQSEASLAINLTPTQRIRHIILPQAMPIILPPMGNLTIEILKGTALVSTIGVSDLAFELDKIRINRTLSETPVSIPILFFNGLVIYFILAQIVNLVFKFYERRVNSRFEQRTGSRAVDSSLLDGRQSAVAGAG